MKTSSTSKQAPLRAVNSRKLNTKPPASVVFSPGAFSNVPATSPQNSQKSHGDVTPLVLEPTEVTSANGEVFQVVKLVKDLDLTKAPTLSDFNSRTVRELLLRACHEYEALIATADAFPDTATCTKWAMACWTNAHCDNEVEKQYEYIDRAHRLVSTLLSLPLID